MAIAYLVNQYPKVSHSFIRVEIAGIEACEVPVERFAIRSCEGELVDPADKLELEKTKVVLEVGLLGLLWGLLKTAATRSQPFIKALGLTFKVGWKSERGLLKHLAYLAEACILLDWFAQSEIDRVHAHFGTNSTTVAMLCHVLGGPPYSFTVHGPEEFDKTQLIALTEKIERASFVVAISSFGRSQLFRWCDRNQWSKIKIVHCGVDRTFLDQPLTPIPDVPRFVCVGRLCEQKGQLLLVEAVKQLAEAEVPCQLVLVGDGPLRAPIEALIERFDLQDRIEITGWASSTFVRQQILSSRALVLPSFAEGLPVVIMEALALGRPVLSTYVAGIPELVEPGICGWLVPAGSVQDLTAAMQKILQCPVATLERMGQAGVERVAQNHDAALEAAKLAGLLQEQHKSASK